MKKSALRIVNKWKNRKSFTQFGVVRPVPTTKRRERAVVPERIDGIR